jgi:hypothetical protein
MSTINGESSTRVSYFQLKRGSGGTEPNFSITLNGLMEKMKMTD